MRPAGPGQRSQRPGRWSRAPPGVVLEVDVFGDADVGAVEEFHQLVAEDLLARDQLSEMR